MRHRHVAQQRLQHGAGEDRADRRCRPWARPNRCSPRRGWIRRRSCSAPRRSDCRGSRCRNAAPAAAHRCRSRRRPTSRRPPRSACPCRTARRMSCAAADGAALQQAGKRAGGKPDAKPDRHRTGPALHSQAAASSPRGSLAAGGFQAGLPLSTAPDFRAWRIIAAGCGRGSDDALGSRRRLPRHADAGGAKQTQLVRTMIDFYGLTSPNVQKIFIMLEEMRASLQFQAGGRLGQRPALGRNSPSSTRTRKSR